MLVTHLLHANTLPTAALKPGWAFAVGRIDTACFITHVPAVILVVALTATMDTSAITTLKLIGTAGGVSTVSFIRLVQAVSFSIALPATMDALSAATAELQGGALMSGSRGGSLCATVLGPLVGAVGAVGVTVAGPQARYTNSVVALEGPSVTGDRRAGGLVTAVVTICLVVTHEGGGHALAVPAVELIVCALFERTALFISSILTVSFPIAAPGAGDTLVQTVQAAEFCRPTRFRRTGTRKLICAISTVVCAITHPSDRDAFPIPALELLRSTCCKCICLKEGAEEKQQTRQSHVFRPHWKTRLH